MSIDFFKECCKTTSKNNKFGLCDDPPPANNPAYIDESDEPKWIAEVQNINETLVGFYAIDHCVDIFKSDGEMESRCDGMLHHENNLTFVELKDRGSRGWLSKGRDQLTITVSAFKSAHDINAFDEVVAYICNKQRPLAITGNNTEVQRFKDDTGFLLRPDRNIII